MPIDFTRDEEIEMFWLAVRAERGDKIVRSTLIMKLSAAILSRVTFFHTADSEVSENSTPEPLDGSAGSGVR